jgi:Ca2+-binding RTX toxin-like protein
LGTSTATISDTGNIFGNTGLLCKHALTLVNMGTIAGTPRALDVRGEAHITNAGTLLGDVDIGTGGFPKDTFTNFMKVGHVIRNGTVTGVIDLHAGDDQFFGGRNAETVRDGDGSDLYKFGGGNDTYIAVGSSPADDGIDTVYGGPGIDTYDASNVNTNAALINLGRASHAGIAPFSAQGFYLTIDTVIGFENAVGGDLNDVLIGSRAANNLIGGLGLDEIRGLGGHDILTGGGGGDTFVFEKLSDSGVRPSARDVITDFVGGQDLIDLASIDANHKLSDDQDFHLTSHDGLAGYTHQAGELRYKVGGANTIVSGDVNGDGKADFSILLKGHVLLHDTDFVL